MGEISFSYNTIFKPKHEFAFKYWFENSIEYSFAYQRYIAFSDASIFNSPVAITKVATGLFQLYDLFVDKESHPLAYHNLINLFDEIQYDTKEQELPLLSKINRDINCNQMYRITRPYSFLLNTYLSTIFADKPDYILNKNTNFISTNNQNNLQFNILLQGVWILTETFMQVYKDYNLEKQYENKMQTYKNMFSISRTNYLDINEGYHLQSIYNDNLQIYKPFIQMITTLHAKKYEGIELQERKEKAINQPEDLMIAPIDNKLNIYKRIRMKQPTLILNVNAQIPLTLGSIKHNNIIEQLYLYRIHYKDTNYNQTFILNTNEKNINVFKSNNLNKNFSNVQFIQSVNSISKPVYKSFYQQEFCLRAYDKPVCRFNIDTFTAHEEKYGCYIKSNSASTSSKNMNVNDTVSTTKQNNHIYILNDYFAKDKNTDISLYKSYWINNVDKNLMKLTQQVLTKDNLLLNLHNNIISSTLNDKYMKNLYENCHANKDRLSFSILYNDSFGYKDKESLPYIYDDIFVYKDNASMIQQDLYVSIYNDKKDINPLNNFVLTYKDSFYMEDRLSITLQIFRDSKIMSIYQTDDTLYKDKYKLKLLTDTWITTSNYYGTLNQYVFIEKNKHMASIYNKIQNFIKQKIFVNTLNIESVIKYRIPAQYINTLNHNFDNAIIPIAKIRHQGYIDNIDSRVQKVSQKGYIDKNLSVSVIPENAFIQTLNLFCDKKEHNAFLQYKNIRVSKNKVHTAIFKDKFVSKNALRHGYSSNDLIWSDKIQKDIFTTNISWIDKQLVKSQILKEDIYFIVEPRKIYYHDLLFVDKIDQMCYYEYGTTWYDKTNVDMFLSNQVQTKRTQQNLHALDYSSSFIKKELNAFYEYGVFNSKTIRESALFRELDTMQKITKDCGLHPNDFGNWTWVYETPDPFDSINYGIDELLLPENDTRYEGFEDIIFNKETMMPRNPVKQIDENTFIAKYPIRHPLSNKYANIAVNYDESAISFENYYGIETRIMHSVFLKFYRIWQSKIFEFGTMSMVQSVKLILEYLYTWIMEYFPLEEIEQALRVFKLIRWYGESSIIQNSQYIIKYEYGLLESKLNTGTCLIPNNLGPDNQTMLIDSKLGVIKNNPTLIGNSNAYVEFCINNKKNTTFTFSLSNTVGSVNIYINEVLVDTISKSAINLTYELPYTGDINVVKIEKEKAHNLNATFYIGNIKVPNGTFTELSIEFDPTLKAGNKPLNDIAKKMIAAANLYDNRDEAYDEIRKGNLGVNELYRKMLEYWELHHQGKSKGKRLTIKEV